MSKNALWIIAVIVVVGGTIASLAFHSKPGYGVFAAVGLVCFTVAMRMPGQRSLWSIYGRQGLVLPFACTLGGCLFGSANQFAAAMILGFVIYGAANVLHHMRETASA